MMVADFGALTIPAAISLFNILFRIFRSISKWIKRKANTQWKEDHRYLKIVNDYCKRHKETGAFTQIFLGILFLTLVSGTVEPHIQYAIEHLKQRKIMWLEYPGARQAATQAQATGDYDEPGYTTDFDDGDSGVESPGDDSPYEESPSDESPGDESPGEVSPYEESPGDNSD